MTGNTLNLLGEFSRKDMEREFFADYMEKSVRFVRPAVLMLGVLHLLFLLPDYLHFRAMDEFLPIALARVLFLLLATLLHLSMKSWKDYRRLSCWITGMELLCVALFLYILSRYEGGDILIQAFGVMVIILAGVLVPNRWINNLVVFVTLSIGFVAGSLVHNPAVDRNEFHASVVYLLLVNVLCSVVTYRNHRHMRRQYLANKKLLYLSMVDHLSGAYNRAKLDVEMRRWQDGKENAGNPFSIIMFDLDHFKKVNDRHGHMAGDRVIVGVADMVRKNIRESDVFARWGGEEFVVLLPGTEINYAREVAQRLRQKAEDLRVPGVPSVTCSFGVAQRRTGESMESLVQRVDKHLYRAKEEGRNRVLGDFPAEQNG
ncbi:GGDEF domain-containing protein [Anaerotalea alkaliphila]|uniref:GGDEF domain-containing protein n=1 Tax=Anaerotalea alkaliphila TaxID=2662126 RepID=A0A7X5HUS1_9FIRM|nr:GGDEF domain-containing protein [Anaerotalea alkaliphila]NDL66999.1 GGDEF domain-containing protein [Anaerotalea alkaliphila]